MRGFLPVVVFLSTLFFANLNPVAFAGEEPELKLSAWLLTLKPLEVNSITVKRASGKGRLDWYLLYSVENRTDQVRPFNPVFTAELLDTDDGKARGPAAGLMKDINVKRKAADIYLPKVEAAVEKKKGENFRGPTDLYPMQKAILEAKGQAAQLQVVGKFRDLITIKPKEIRRCIATFGPLDAEADVVKIYVRNLTGTVDVKIVDGKRVLEEYVLVLKYKIPGDEFGRGQDRFNFEGKQWIKVPREMPAGASAPDGGTR